MCVLIAHIKISRTDYNINKMPKSSKHYRLLALDIVNKRVIDETFPTLDEMIEKYGKCLDITRRKCESIRKCTELSKKKYKHVCICEIETSKRKLKQMELSKSPPI